MRKDNDMKTEKLIRALPVLTDMGNTALPYGVSKQVKVWLQLAREAQAKAREMYTELVGKHNARALGNGTTRFEREEDRSAFEQAWKAVMEQDVPTELEPIDLRGEIGTMRISAAALEALEEIARMEGDDPDETAENEIQLRNR